MGQHTPTKEFHKNNSQPCYRMPSDILHPIHVVHSFYWEQNTYLVTAH